MLNIFWNINEILSNNNLIRIAAKFNEACSKIATFPGNEPTIMNNSKKFYKMLLGFSVSISAEV